MVMRRDLVDECVGVERGGKREAEAQVLWLRGRLAAGWFGRGEGRGIGK